MKYLSILLSFVASFVLSMLAIQTMRWDDSISFTLLSTFFAIIFFAVGVELRKKV
tara:strand:+ start:588 stop:752 length:165 start_codon:yes stop_codon:yes gene_type:complete